MTPPDPKEFAKSVRRQMHITRLLQDANSLVTDVVPKEKKTAAHPQQIVGEFTDADGKRHPLTVIRFPRAKITMVLLGPRRRR
jgi:hypothetical protein